MKFMRSRNTSIFLTVFAFCTVIFSPLKASAAFTFSRPLTIGMSGLDVLELQKVLNSSSDTQISSYGSGSPGNETIYFGGLTKASVTRFQEKYAAKILIPNGLSAGTGFVGASTIAVLNAFEVQKSLVPAISSSTPLLTPVPVQSPVSVASYPAPISSSTNPNNLRHLNTLLADIQRVGTKQGYTSQQLENAKQAALVAVATSTDLEQAFIDAAQKSMAVKVFPEHTAFGGALNSFLAGINDFVKPQPVFAQAGTPFGGSLLTPLYCTQSQNWYLDINPLAPTYVALLTYQLGSQLYLMFDLPFALNMLGSYTGGSPCIEGECPYCFTLPTEGMVAPGTGSS